MTEAPATWQKPDPIPDPVATTERLVLRWFTRDDAGALHEAIDRSRDTLHPFLPWAYTSHANPIQSHDFIDDCTRARSLVEADNFALGVFLRESGEFVGGSGFHRIDYPSATAEVGYWTDEAHRRRGYCAEATAAMITTGFADWGLRRIKICCATVNAGSVAVAEKLGLRLEGHERAERWTDGHGWTDQFTYAVLADEWDSDEGRSIGGSSPRRKQ